MTFYAYYEKIYVNSMYLSLSLSLPLPAFQVGLLNLEDEDFVRRLVEKTQTNLQVKTIIALTRRQIAVVVLRAQGLFINALLDILVLNYLVYNAIFSTIRILC